MATDKVPSTMVVINDIGYLSTGNLFIDRHARRLIDTLVEERFRSEVNAWAASEDGRLRTRLAIRFEIAGEFEILCAALGSWAFARGDELFPADESSSGDRWS